MAQEYARGLYWVHIVVFVEGCSDGFLYFELKKLHECVNEKYLMNLKELL